MLFKGLYPTHFENSTFDVDFAALYSRGIRGVLFDVDNTLVPHGAPADERAIAFFEQLRKIGFSYCFISNNKEERVKTFSEVVGGTYIYKAGKPSKRSYVEGMIKMNTDVNSTVFIGDQLFTDIWGANRAGVESFLVRQIDSKEEIQIVIKRFLERMIIALWKLGGK